MVTNHHAQKGKNGGETVCFVIRSKPAWLSMPLHFQPVMCLRVNRPRHLLLTVFAHEGLNNAARKVVVECLASATQEICLDG